MAVAFTAATTAATVLAALVKAKPAWDALKKKIESSKNAKEILDALKEAVHELQCVRMDYETMVETNKPKVPSETFKQWIHKVDNIENQVKEFEANYDQERSRFFVIFPPSRSDLIKRMKKTSGKVDKLFEAGNQLKDRLFINPRLEAVVKNKDAPEIKRFGTLQQKLEKILELLGNDKVNGIGIFGPLGIGKTTIMWNLNNHEEVAKMFEIVIWVNVSTEGSKENLSGEILQEAILQRLDIQMEGNRSSYKNTISSVLKNTKCLLLLDDVKENFSLRELGIPDNGNGSKFVLTSRSRQVCSSMVDRMVTVPYLTSDESWKMFRDVLQNLKLTKNLKIVTTAWRVCQECCGLPLLIEKIASTFKLKNSEVLWNDGLRSWRKWPEKDCHGIKELFKLLKFCYEDLDDDCRKKCFLYGALYPEDEDIYTDHLLECWAAEEHFLGTGRNESLMIGHSILSHLKNVSLLEEGKTEKHITMHKFMRQMALHILEDDLQSEFLVLASRELPEPPAVESWIKKSKISLGNNELDRLPDSPNCTRLSTLFLQKNLGLDIIPEEFFKHMKNLRVLDLSHTGIELLPSSISILIRLKVLYLHNCTQLKELPSHIVRLLQLEALDIRGSGVNNIPPLIEMMTCLRRLRVSFVESGNENATREVCFNYNVISKLSQLEELTIDVKSPEHWSSEVVKNIIKQVAKLQGFMTLKFCFYNKIVDIIEIEPKTLRIWVPKAIFLLIYITSLPKDKQKISSFQFFIGGQNSDPQLPNYYKYHKYLKYCDGIRRSFPILRVLAEANAFELVNHKGIKRLPDFLIPRMKNVQSCLIEDCDTIETMMSTVDVSSLQSLEHLYLKNLPKFEILWEGPPEQPGILTKITTLVLIGCRILVKIFPPSVIQQFHELQHLKIEECPEIEEVIMQSDAAGNLLVLPKLRKLRLRDMPKLRSICAVDSLQWPFLQKLKIFKCPRLCELPFNENNAQGLNLIKAEEQWWEALQWQNPKFKESLQKFCTLR